MSDTVTFRIPGAAGEAIQIDAGASMFGAEYDYRAEKRGKGWSYVVAAPHKVARRMLLDCVERGEPQGREGYDQPASWGAACRKAAETIRAALAKAEGR